MATDGGSCAPPSEGAKEAAGGLLLVGAEAAVRPVLVAAAYAMGATAAAAVGKKIDPAEACVILKDGDKEVAKGGAAVLKAVISLPPALKGVDGCAMERVDQWLAFAEKDLGKINGDCDPSSETVQTALKALESALTTETYLAGQRVSIADIAVWGAISASTCLAAEVEKQQQHASLSRWFKTCSFQFAKQTKVVKVLEVVESLPDNAVIAKLNELGIPSTTHRHEVCMTVQAQMEEIGHLPGKKTKNLFLRDKKHGLFLLTAAHDSKTDTKALGRQLGLAGANLRFADESILTDVLGVKQGSVGPLAVLNDTEGKCTLVLDKSLLGGEGGGVDTALVNSHPLRNDMTTAITAADLLKYAKACEHEPRVLEFTQATEQGMAAAANAKAGKAAAAGGGGGGGKAPQKAKGKQPKDKKKMEDKKPARAADSTKELKKETQLAIDKDKVEDFPGWYTQVITYSEMIDYSDISGCYILRPWAFQVWEHIQRWFDTRIKEDHDVSNSYFPLFVSKKALEAEENHVEGFAPEVAWVTRSGEEDLAEPIAVRPTSETIMYPCFAKWIQSHRDLPLKLNQWSNVVRWEFKDPTPFLRSREFLWQEGHTAHETEEEAQEMVMAALELYRRVYEELLAVPVIPGYKTEGEKFAGGVMTTTVEAYITGSGRAIQGATSHNLGTGFGDMFNISYEGKDGKAARPIQTSWGITTRSIGVCVMVHGDNRGLVLPPRVSPLQAVVIPIISKKCPPEMISPYSKNVHDVLKAAGVRVKEDDRTNYTAGFKYNHWEQKGVPLRIEIGPRDMESEQVVIVRRDTGEKMNVKVSELKETSLRLLEDIQSSLFAKALKERDECLCKVYEWKDFVPRLNEDKMVLTPWCDQDEWEEKVKAMSRDEALGAEGEEDERSATPVAAKTLCKPFSPPPLEPGTKCFVSGLPATCWVLWGRSY